MKYTAVQLDRDLVLKLASTGPEDTQQVIVRLSPVSAQQLADALVAYARGETEGKSLGRSVGIPVEDWTQHAEPPAPGVVKLPKKGVVYVGTKAVK